MLIVQSVFGTIALATSTIGLLPQSYKALKTRSTQDVSMIMLINYLCCSIAWVIYGYYIHSTFVVWSNIVGLASSLLLTFQKLHYDKFAR